MHYNLKILQLLERVYLLWKYILIDISMVCTMIYMGYTVFGNLQGCWAEQFHVLEHSPKHDVQVRIFCVGTELYRLEI